MLNSPIRNQINTIFVHVGNLKESVKWYCTLLGQEFDESSISNPVYNIRINHQTGLTLDAGPVGETKEITPSPYPLFNFQTDDIEAAYKYVYKLGFSIASERIDFDDFSFFTVKDPDGHIVMICTG